MLNKSGRFLNTLKAICLIFPTYLFFLNSLTFNNLFAANTPVNESQQQVNDFSLAGYGEKGKKTWDLSGKSADMFTDNVIFDDVTGNLYGETEDVRLTADKGDFHKTEGKVHLEKDVVITTSSGAKLTTDSLDWDRKRNIVTTKDKVNIERDNMTTTSLGATGNPALNKVSLEKDVKVEIKPDDVKNKEKKTALNKEKIIITCDGPLLIDYEKNIATFHNNVKVDRRESQIYSDTMDIYFKKDSDSVKKEPGVMDSKIDKIVARGNVKIIKGENISYSEEAIYNSGDKRIMLSGRPKLVILSTEGMDASFGN